MIVSYIQPASPHTWEALNIGSIAALVKRECRATEQRFFSGFYESDEEILSGCDDADIVAISSTTPQICHARELADSVRERNPRALIVLGGFHPSAVPDEVLEEKTLAGEKRFDIAVVGEGEQAMVDIVNGCRERKIKREYIQDLDSLPWPDRDLIQQDRQLKKTEKTCGERLGAVFQTRGCPFACSFCASRAVWGRKQRARSARNCLDEMIHLRDKWNVDAISLADDEAGIYRDQWMEFCDLKQQEAPEIRFGCNLVASTVITWEGKESDHILRRMWAAGCRDVWIGVESGSSAIMLESRKPITKEKVKTCFMMANNLGFKTRAYFLLGLPSESEADIYETERFVEEIQPSVVGFTVLIPLPGSSFYDPKFHRSINWRTTDEYHNDFWRTKYLTNEQLRFHRDRLTQKFKDRITWHNTIYNKDGLLVPEERSIMVKANPGRSGI